MALYDIVIKGGTVVDGLRTPRYKADVGIKDGKVAQIGGISASDGVEVVDAAGKVVCGYTFDAGPNAVVYYLAENEERVAGTFKNILGDKTGWEGKNVKSEVQVPEGNEVAVESLKKGISRVIITSVGDGPRKTEEHLC